MYLWFHRIKFNFIDKRQMTNVYVWFHGIKFTFIDKRQTYMFNFTVENLRVDFICQIDFNDIILNGKP